MLLIKNYTSTANPVIVDTESNYQPCLDKIMNAITPLTKAVVTVSPNNPSGAVYNAVALQEINKLCKETNETNNLEAVISNFKPAIFWKDKEIVKQQIKSWSHKNVEKLIYKINEIELLIKKNSNKSVIILSDFIIEQSSTISN